MIVLMAGEGPIATTALGGYRGVRSDDVDVWRGIAYAQRPVGDLRWRRARPVAPHDGVVDADKFSAVCPQQIMPAVPLGENYTMSEDCLYLNVWTPAGAVDRDATYPVMVWLHGGAYMFGCGSQPVYDATHLVTDGKVIVVTINYRLGAFGFADFSSIDPDRFDTNPALSDVLLALTWVRDNIGAFGGDAANTTLFGESAGGGLVTTLVTMPAAGGLFARAIAQSSPATSVYEQGRATFVAKRFLEALRHSGGSSEGSGQTEPQPADAQPTNLKPTELLTGASADDLVAASMVVFAEIPSDQPGIIAFTPIVDGDLVPQHPLDAYTGGTSLPVPLMIGTNKDEASLFVWMKSPLMPISPANIERMFVGLKEDHPELELPDQAQIYSAYSGLRPKVAGLGVARDVAFRMPTVWVAEGHSRHQPVYLYRFDWATRMLRALRIGATHATELPYLWGNLVSGPRDITFKLGGKKTGEEISARMIARWTAFAHGGVPSADDVEPQWPSYSADNRSTLVIDATDSVVDDLDGELRTTWGEAVIGFR